MGLLVDMVPNHVGINDTGNKWWMDVLENGRSSPYASFLDIDWTKPGCDGKLLVPTLGSELQQVIEKGEIGVCFLNQKGFRVKYYSQEFPIDPATYPYILEVVLKHLKASQHDGKLLITITNF
jgi:(1->4)-alpha-D-glucan 1-alpha-D-glucosylmutase